MSLDATELAKPWRFADLFDRGDLPECAHYEVVDGHLVVTPPPSSAHQRAVSRLLVQMTSCLSDEWEVLAGVGIGFGGDGRVPDLVAVRRGVGGRRGHVYFQPNEVGLVIEVMSPGSRKTDLFAKPGEYAEAGIPLFWRLDLSPSVQLHAFVLRDGAYAEAGVVDARGRVPVPWGEMEIDLRNLAELLDG
jgi:Uma2 family endonuclease